MRIALCAVALLLAGCGEPYPWVYIHQEAIDAAQACLKKGDYAALQYYGRLHVAEVRCTEDSINVRQAEEK